jgi:hypothetical protein
MAAAVHIHALTTRIDAGEETELAEDQGIFYMQEMRTVQVAGNPYSLEGLGEAGLSCVPCLSVFISHSS